jgi:hypothetical protein
LLLVPQRFAALSTPRNEAGIDLVAQMGVQRVLTLKREEPLDAQWFAFRVGARGKLERRRRWPSWTISMSSISANAQGV